MKEKTGRSFSWIGFVLYAVAALRALTYRSPNPLDSQSTNPLAHTLFLAPILLLLLSDPALFRRFPGYRWVYFPLQAGLIQGLGLVPPYQDTWGILYVAVCIQAFAYLPAAWALGLSLFFAASLLTTLTLTMGVSVGLALGLTVVAGSALIVSNEVIFKQAERDRRESQRLLTELQKATQQLQVYTAQVEEISAAQERNRLAHELHDSVSQTVFSISLMAQSVRMLLEKDPAQVGPQLQALQELTGGALAQMRSLIQQWRPPAEKHDLQT